MSKDKLEDFVRENRAAFDQEMPSAGLWSRIEANIPASPRNGRPWGRYLLRAASVILVAGAAWMVNDLLDKPGQITVATTGDTPGVVENPEVRELLEAEVYYASQFDERIKLVEDILSDQPEILDELRTEFTHLDSVYAGLKDELNQNIETEQIIMAMIENHRIKAEILSEILNQLKPEDSDHEKIYHF